MRLRLGPKTILVVLFLCLFLLPSLQASSIRVVYFEQFEPFSWSNGARMQGLFIDLVDEVFKQNMGVEVSHEGFPWKRAQLLVQSGRADAMITIATLERLTYTIPIGPPVVEMEFKIFTARNHSRLNELKAVTSMADLKSFALIDILGSGWAKSN